MRRGTRIHTGISSSGGSFATLAADQAARDRPLAPCAPRPVAERRAVAVAIAASCTAAVAAAAFATSHAATIAATIAT